MTNLRSLSDLFKPARKLAAVCSFATAIAVAASAQTNTFPGSGNAGVGTTSPGNKLEVKAGSGGSDATVDGLAVSSTNTTYSTKGRFAFNYDRTYITQNAYFNGSAWLSDNSSRAASLIILHSGDADSSISFFTSAANNNGVGAERMRIDKNGNVGIGTTNPGRPLVVAADASGIPLRVYRNVNNVGYGTGINWAFNNNAGNVTDYAYVNSTIVSNSAGAESGALGFFTVKAGTMTQQAIIDQNGNVGIGTNNPSQKLEVYNATGPTYFKATSGSAGTYLGTDGTNSYIQAVSPNQKIFLSKSDGSAVLTADTGTGNVGIGKSPTVALDVQGDIKASGTIHVKYQDLAEWVPSSKQLSAGTVVVLDTTKSNQVVSSTVAYDTRVAGVISAQPGITLGESGAGKVLVATTGRVRVKVDASRGAIHIGDILVTSDVLGVAMKSEAVNLGGVQIHRPGTIIGKALEPLAKGSGEILVLLSLQ